MKTNDGASGRSTRDTTRPSLNATRTSTSTIVAERPCTVTSQPSSPLRHADGPALDLRAENPLDARQRDDQRPSAGTDEWAAPRAKAAPPSVPDSRTASSSDGPGSSNSVGWRAESPRPPAACRPSPAPSTAHRTRRARAPSVRERQVALRARRTQHEAAGRWRASGSSLGHSLTGAAAFASAASSTATRYRSRSFSKTSRFAVRRRSSLKSRRTVARTSSKLAARGPRGLDAHEVQPIARRNRTAPFAGGLRR